MRNDLYSIRFELTQIAEKEADYLWRLARRMKKHGCSQGSILKGRKARSNAPDGGCKAA